MRKMFIIMLIMVYQCHLAAIVRSAQNGQELETILAYSKGPTVVIVTGSWCGICTSLKKEMPKLFEHPSTQNITFIELDYNQAPEIAKKYTVDRVPAFIFFNKGAYIKTDYGIKNIDTALTEIEQKISQIFSESDLNQTVAHNNSWISLLMNNPLSCIRNGINWCINTWYS